MIFDTIIIGGGLSGLTCGIHLQKAGKRCVIISSGQSALHFSSGSFDLLNTLPDGRSVSDPVQSLDELQVQNPSHPYIKIGKTDFIRLAEKSQQLLTDASISVGGSYQRNHYRLTPFAITKPTWLTMTDYVSSDQPDSLPWKNVCLVHFTGYLDFHPDFFQGKFQELGIKVQNVELDLTKVSIRKNTPLEVRSTNIARLFDNEEALDNFVRLLAHKVGDADAVLLPACLGLERTNIVNILSRKLGVEVKLLATFPPTVSGIRAQYLLKQRFMQLGGTYMLGDTVNKVDFENNHISKIFTVNHGNIPLRGEEYVLCSGSFFSEGLVALPNDVVDPICGLDVDYISDRKEWFASDVFDQQNYESFGIRTNETFHGIKNGQAISNLHVCGASLSAFNALKEGCGGGVSMLTALYVAEDILRQKENK